MTSLARSSAGRCDRFTTGNAIVSEGAITWVGRPSTAANVVRSASWRLTISFTLRSRSRDAHRERDGNGGWDVVKRAARHQLVEEPQALLRKRQRGIWPTFDPPQRGAPGVSVLQVRQELRLALPHLSEKSRREHAFRGGSGADPLRPTVSPRGPSGASATGKQSQFTLLVTRGARAPCRRPQPVDGPRQA